MQMALQALAHPIFLQVTQAMVHRRNPMATAMRLFFSILL